MGGHFGTPGLGSSGEFSARETSASQRKARLEIQNFQTLNLPIGSMVAPFWDYLIESYIKRPQKGTTMEPMGAVTLSSPGG